jgi:hypothetical protein
MVFIHKWHLLPRGGVLRGFAPAACEKAVLDVSRLKRDCGEPAYKNMVALPYREAPPEGRGIKPLCGLASRQNLPFLNEHLTVPPQEVLFAKIGIYGRALDTFLGCGERAGQEWPKRSCQRILNRLLTIGTKFEKLVGKILLRGGGQ